MGIEDLKERLSTPVSAFPLAVFRIVFGIVLCFSQVRFLAKGWVEALFLVPTYHFTYPGFDWVQVLPAPWMYALLACSIIGALGIALGFFYRWSTLLFFLTFTYLELIDKAWYLNHYYFVSLMAFLLLWVPANQVVSLDTYFKRTQHPESKSIPRWALLLIQFQIFVVYFFAGIAKLKYDWLVKAEPMKTWLAARTDFPLLGSWFDQDWVAYAFSWGGTLYDLLIPFFLLIPQTRLVAFLAVILFHGMTGLLFPIGMFPWIMIGAALIFFTEEDWKKLLGEKPFLQTHLQASYTIPSGWVVLLGLYMGLQIFLPLRHYSYPGNVLWNEKGLRFAWHVMVMEKNGMTSYEIVDLDSEKKWTVYPSQYLIPAQERQMSFQPDMIFQFAEHLRGEWKMKGYPHVQITIENRTCVNKECRNFQWVDPT